MLFYRVSPVVMPSHTVGSVALLRAICSGMLGSPHLLVERLQGIRPGPVLARLPATSWCISS